MKSIHERKLRRRLKLPRLDVFTTGKIVIVCLFIVMIISMIWVAAANYLEAGYVADKRHVDAYYSTEYYVKYINGESIRIPYTEYHPERWWLIVVDEDRTKRNMWDVSEDYYNTVKTGDYVRRDRRINNE